MHCSCWGHIAAFLKETNDMTYKTVLFDMDGTLLDSLSDMHDAVNHILAENGWAAEAEIRAFFGQQGAELMERSDPETRLKPLQRKCFRDRPLHELPRPRCPQSLGSPPGFRLPSHFQPV